MRQPWEQNPEAWKHTPEEITDAEEARRRAVFATHGLEREFDRLTASIRATTASLQRFADAAVEAIAERRERHRELL